MLRYALQELEIIYTWNNKNLSFSFYICNSPTTIFATFTLRLFLLYTDMNFYFYGGSCFSFLFIYFFFNVNILYIKKNIHRIVFYFCVIVKNWQIGCFFVLFRLFHLLSLSTQTNTNYIRKIKAKAFLSGDR